MPALPPVASVFSIKYIGSAPTKAWQCRIFFTWSGTTPNNTTCAALATLIQNALAPGMQGFLMSGYGISTTEVTDLSSSSSGTGFSTGSLVGSGAGTGPIDAAAVRLKFLTARRYRGGHPGIYWPQQGQSFMADASHWTSGHVGSLQTTWTSYITTLTGLSSGGTSLTNHVWVSYYQGFHNVTLPSGRVESRPTLRTTPQVDVVSAYSAETLLSYQTRRAGRK